MNPLILNRDFTHPADGWYQIEPKGEHPNRAAGVVQVIDDEAAKSIVNRFNADAAKPTFPGMLIDHEHFKHDVDKESRAYGWLMKLQNREDGIYGQIKWTNTGKDAVDGGDYRFFSTEYDPQDLKILNDGKAKRIRPLRLDGLTLTNSPNNRGGKPITNRNNLAESRDSAASNQNQNERTNTMKSIAQKLGLAAEASEDAILAEVTKIQNRITTLTPFETENTTLKNRNTELEGEQAESLMDAHGMKPDDAARAKLKPVLIGLKNREDRMSFLKDCVKPIATTTTAATTQVKLHNRDTTPPGKGAATEEADTKTESAKATKIMNRAHELMGQMKHLSLPTATRMAQNEIENAS